MYVDAKKENEITIIIADDHLLFSDGVRLLLQQQPDFFVTAVVENGKELLSLLQTSFPKILLLDINMPGLNGLEVLQYLRRSNSSTAVILLSTYNEPYLVEKAKNLGANGYLLKSFGPDELVKAIRAVYAGESYFPEKQLRHVETNHESDSFLKQFHLTKREKEILQLIREDLTNKQISVKLFLSIYTVETHRKNIMQKLGLASPGALMRFLVSHSLL